jgi:CubicO group peptidase (beta-lactamase class C family)
VVVVVADGSGADAARLGYADAAKRTPVLPARTLVPPGSVSKLFTWTAVMQQVEAGKIDLDKDVNAYLDFKIPLKDGKPVTMRQHDDAYRGVRGIMASSPCSRTAKFQIPLGRW